LEQFKVSLAGKLASPWNKEAAEVFTNSFIGSGWYQCRDRSYIKKVFMTHLHQLRNLYASQQSLASPEVNDEAIQAASDQKKRASRYARRRSVGSFDPSSSLQF
jgi:hypothetical protein